MNYKTNENTSFMYRQRNVCLSNTKEENFLGNTNDNSNMWVIRLEKNVTIFLLKPGFITK